jgi:hypothetical protein
MLWGVISIELSYPFSAASGLELILLSGFRKLVELLVMSLRHSRAAGILPTSSAVYFSRVFLHVNLLSFRRDDSGGDGLLT